MLGILYLKGLPVSQKMNQQWYQQAWTVTHLFIIGDRSGMRLDCFYVALENYDLEG